MEAVGSSSLILLRIGGRHGRTTVHDKEKLLAIRTALTHGGASDSTIPIHCCHGAVALVETTFWKAEENYPGAVYTKLNFGDGLFV